MTSDLAGLDATKQRRNDAGPTIDIGTIVGETCSLDDGPVQVILAGSIVGESGSEGSAGVTK